MRRPRVGAGVHPWLGPWIPWLVLVHVLGAFLFALAHGPSAWVMWRLRREREPARVAALLDLSRSANAPSWASILLLGLSGLALAAAEHVWREPWLWGSVLVFALVALAMSALAARSFNHARLAAGLRWFDGKGVRPGSGVVDAPALEAALASVRRRAPATLGIGLAGLVVLVWLMVARPG